MMKSSRRRPFSLNRTDSFEILQGALAATGEVYNTSQMLLSNKTKAENTSPTPDILKTELPIFECQKSLNQAERSLVKHIAQIFMTQQTSKPSKIFIRINQAPSEQPHSQEICMISKIEISRDPLDEEKEGKSLEFEKQTDLSPLLPLPPLPPLQSLSEIQQKSIKTSGESSLKQANMKANREPSLLEILGDEEQKSEIKDRSRFTICRKIAMGYHPEQAEAGLVYQATKPFMNEQHSNIEFDELQESNYSSGMEDKLFTRLIDLSYFKELQALKTKAQHQTNQKERAIEKAFAKLEQKSSETIKQITSELKLKERQLSSIKKQIVRQISKTTQLNKYIIEITLKANELKAMNAEYMKETKELKKQVKEVQLCMKEMKSEMMAKEAALKELKEREQDKSQQMNKEQLSQAENRFQSKDTDIRSIKSIPFRLDMADVKQGINRVLSDRSPVQHSSETYFTPNGCPFIVVNSTRQTEVRERQPEMKKTTVQRKIDSPETVVSAVRNSKSSEHFKVRSIISRQSSVTHSNVSNLSKRSAFQTVGFVKKTEKVVQSGKLLDYMIDDVPPPPSEEKLSPTKWRTSNLGQTKVNSLSTANISAIYRK